MIDYSREEYAERERAEKDRWDAQDRLPTLADLSEPKPKDDDEELDYE